MGDRPDPSPLAAGGIWVAALIGSWAMALAVLGAVNGEVLGCESGSATAASDADGANAASWVILGAASLVPVMAMTAAAPARHRARLIGLAVVVGILAMLVAVNGFGLCI